MPTLAETVESIAAATTLNERVQHIRKIGEEHGTNEQPSIFAALADRLYVPLLTPDFAYIHWRELYELSDLVPVYERLVAATDTFKIVSENNLTAVVREDPRCAFSDSSRAC